LIALVASNIGGKQAAGRNKLRDYEAKQSCSRKEGDCRIMAQQVELEIAPREVTGKAVRHLRKDGIIPGNIFGHKEPSFAVQLDAVAFDQLHRKHGTRNIIRLRLPDASTQTALIRRVQRDAVTGHVLHVDFSRVSLEETVDVKIPLHFVGESHAVKNLNGVLLTLVDALEVDCRADAMVDALEVDISPLEGFDSVLHAKDIKLPRNYKLVTDPDEPVVKVAPPKIEVPEVEAEAAPAAEEAAPSAPAPEASE
jgi:large subunit ribosomal protein L25